MSHLLTIGARPSVRTARQTPRRSKAWRVLCDEPTGRTQSHAQCSASGCQEVQLGRVGAPTSLVPRVAGRGMPPRQRHAALAHPALLAPLGPLPQRVVARRGLHSWRVPRRLAGALPSSSGRGFLDCHRAAMAGPSFLVAGTAVSKVSVAADVATNLAKSSSQLDPCDPWPPPPD